MKSILLTLGILLSSTMAYAGAEWRSKPVQCGALTEIYDYFIAKEDLQLISQSISYSTHPITDELSVVGNFIFVNPDTTRYIIVEMDSTQTGCVIQYGENFEFTSDPEIVKLFRGELF